MVVNVYGIPDSKPTGIIEKNGLFVPYLEYKFAKDSVKSRLVLEAVAADAKIEVAEDEMQEKLKELAKAYGKTEEELKDNAELKNYVEENLKMEKTVEYIVSNAKIK